MEVGGAAAAGLFQLSAAMQLQDLLPPGVPHQDQSAFPQVPASSPQKVLGFVGWGSVVLPPFIQMHPKPPTQLLSISLNTECFSTAFRLMFWHTFTDSPHFDSYAQDKPNSEVFIILLHHSIFVTLHFFPWGSRTLYTFCTSYTPGLKLWVLQRLFSSTP